MGCVNKTCLRSELGETWWCWLHLSSASIFNPTDDNYHLQLPQTFYSPLSHEENLIVSQLSHCSVVYEDRTLQSNENKDELPAVQWVTLYENRFSLQCDRKCLFLSRAAYLKRLIVCSPHRQHQQMQQV